MFTSAISLVLFSLALKLKIIPTCFSVILQYKTFGIVKIVCLYCKFDVFHIVYILLAMSQFQTFRVSGCAHTVPCSLKSLGLVSRFPCRFDCVIMLLLSGQAPPQKMALLYRVLLIRPAPRFSQLRIEQSTRP